MKNIMIVEGITDKKFVEAYLAYLQQTFPQEYFLIDTIEEAKGQDGIYRILNALKIRINTGRTKNIGILVDADDEGVTGKIASKINPAIEKVFGVAHAITSPNERVSIEYNGMRVNLMCHIFHCDGKGELEDLLKEIRLYKDSTSPNCLDRFVECVGGCNEAYSLKEYKKNFIYFYGYDCLKLEGLNPADTKTRLKAYGYYSPQYWDFGHPRLNELQQFFQLFSETAER